MRRWLPIVAALICSATIAFARANRLVFAPDAAHIQWDRVPPGIPSAIRMKMIEGSLTRPGPFVVLFKFPPGCTVHTHVHPVSEVVTVLSGIFEVGLGPKFDKKKLAPLKPGGYLYLPANTPHYGWTRGGAIMEVEMMGPFMIRYLHSPPAGPRC